MNRFFDGQYNSFDRAGQPVFGPLQTDRPHLFEVQATYDLPWHTQVGAYWLAQTGTPEQTQMSELLRFAATAYLDPPIDGVSELTTASHDADILLARTPSAAARTWYWRLTDAERAACMSIVVSAWIEPATLADAIYKGPGVAFSPKDGWHKLDPIRPHGNAGSATRRTRSPAQ